jgi:hypothetical protein
LAGLLDPDRTRIFQSCGPVPKRRGPATKMEMTLESVASGYFQMATARGFIVTDPAKLPTSRLRGTDRAVEAG